jgi:membrane protein YdbS with pleckstrin-like domain
MASVYAIAIGLSSSSPLLFAISILISFIFAFAFGMTSALHHNFQEIQALPWVKEFATISIMLIFITPASERFKRHIIKGKRFWVWFDEE